MKRLLAGIAVLGLLIVGASALIISASAGDQTAVQEPVGLDSATTQQESLVDRLFDDTSFQADFVGNGPFSIVGSVTVFTDDLGNRVLRLDENFQTERGGQLTLILRSQSGEVVNLGDLQRLDGVQDYLLPDQIDLNTFDQVQVWDEQLNTDRGNAFLTAG